jgi:hypothetical protein
LRTFITKLNALFKFNAIKTAMNSIFRLCLCFIIICIVNCSPEKENPESILNDTSESDDTGEADTISVIPAYPLVRYAVTANDMADISLELNSDSNFNLFFQMLPLPDDEMMGFISDTTLYTLSGRWDVVGRKYRLLSNKGHGFNLNTLFGKSTQVHIVDSNTFTFDTLYTEIGIWGIDCEKTE